MLKNNARMLLYSVLLGAVVATLSANTLTAQIIGSQSVKDRQTKPSPENRTPLTLDFLPKKIQEIREQIEAAESEESEKTAAAMGVKLTDLQLRTAKLREIQNVYQRLMTAMNKQEALRKEEAFLEDQTKVKRQSTLSENPPYSLSFYDGVRGKTLAVEAQRDSVRVAAKLAEGNLAEARLRLEEAKKAVRALKEKASSGDPSVVTPKLRMDLEVAQLSASLAQASLDYQQIHMANLRSQGRLLDLNLETARQNENWVRSHLRYDQGDFEKQLKAYEQSRSMLQSRLNELTEEQVRVEAAWLQAQEALEAARDESGKAFAKAKLEEREAWRQTYQRLLEQTEDMLMFVGQQEQAWKNRYALIKGDVGDEVQANWAEEAERSVQSAQRVLQMQQSDLAGLQGKIASLETQVSSPDIDPQIKPLMENRLQALRRGADHTLEYLSALLATAQMQRRLLDEVSEKRGQMLLSERVGDIGEKVRKIWNFEIIAIDDKPVTVSKVTVAFLILILGILTLRFTFSLLRKRVLPHVQVKATTAAAVEKMLYYFGLLLIVLFALRMVNIPLTAFAFFGGAIAIGVGFGAQALINNFISGFIIMAERPIKIGDLVEVDGNFAMVEEIGARCTRIRTGANVHILVPNSSFLEKNIINWTLSDQMVRTNVAVGVIYGSPVQEVRRLLIQAAAEHNRVLRTPEPFVLFNDFGDNALIFDVCFWIRITRLIERRLIESDIRFRIDELFREAGIVIAFPQRDVHLDTQKPLELKIVRPDDGAENP